MNIVINETATQLVITDANLTNTISTMLLDWKYGCSSTVLPITVFGKIAGITSNSFTLTLGDLYPTNTPSKIADGVHYFQLTYTYVPAPSQVTTVTTNFCLVVDYDLKCKLLKSDDVSLLEKYQALFYANDCDSCECTTTCKLYNDILFELGITTTTTNDSACGCN